MTNEVKKFRWSFSQWEAYNSCPQKWKFQSVMKLPRSPAGPAAARGLEMHDRVEHYIKGEIDDISPPGGLMFGGKKPAVIAEKFVSVLDAFREHETGDKYAEFRMGFDEEWYLCGGMSKNASCVGVLDAARMDKDMTLHIGEWKSGKPKDTHKNQRELYALFGLRRWRPEVVHVTTHYLEGTAPSERLSVKATAEPKLIKIWDERAAKMQRDKICAPRPQYGCTWCDYAKSKGGPCQFG